MQILIALPAFFLFLYFIYKLVKDDYVFIRKNISLEQMFDLTFIVIWISLFFSRVFFFIFHPQAAGNIFFTFFSFQVQGLSLLGFVLGGIGAVYLIGKYKKFPLGRLFDFFTLAFVMALPLVFLSYAVFKNNYQLILSLGNALVYFIFAVFCWKYVYPKINSRELKEGNLPVIFSLFFSIVSLVNTTLLQQQGKITLISLESILLFLLVLLSLTIFIKQARDGFFNKKR